MDQKDDPPPYSGPSQQWLQEQMVSTVQNQYVFPVQTNTGLTPTAPYPQTMQHNPSEIIVTSTASPSLGVGEPRDYTDGAQCACLCFWPTGRIAISRASESRDALARGDIAGAHKAADQALLMIRISYAVGLVTFFIILSIVMTVAI